MANQGSAVHADEVKSGMRFEFGSNWKRFLKGLTVPQIKLAENSLRTALGLARLDGLSFLDVGSGSGLFSLAARRLGAKVHSFDYDPESVLCTTALRDRYFPDDRDWTVGEGSVLDESFVKSLGEFDIVYSWGVLHHTGNMWDALRIILPSVKVGGFLYIALYNDQGEQTDRWESVKRRYNSLPNPLAFLYAAAIVAREEFRDGFQHLRQGTLREWVKTWTEYSELSTRGMSRWHDWIDWVGGFPYERTRIEPVVDLVSDDGFELSHIVDRSSGYGCNEFVFRRIAPAGTQVESRIPGSSSISRRFGSRVRPPFERDERGWTAAFEPRSAAPFGSELLLIRDDAIIGPVEFCGDDRIRLADFDADADQVTRARYFVVTVTERPLAPPYLPRGGTLFEADASDLTSLADNVENPTASSVFLFEDDRQLGPPHAVHGDISKYGGGRFSHWGASVYFSSSDGTDPRTNGRSYRLMMPPQPLPPDRSLGKLYGVPVYGPFEHGQDGWLATVDIPAERRESTLALIKDDRLVGEARWTEQGRLIIAPPEAHSSTIYEADFRLVPGEIVTLEPPFTHLRGHLWEHVMEKFADRSDRAGDDNVSPMFLFENEFQMPLPHSPHDDIARAGRGRFSHWESSLFFSPSDDTDPNTNGRRYTAVVATGPRSS
jgi:2-polyprenyl-6-hydroxyphenyl methylase/3-demethylubiquinone-9 3-methyltransferase